MTELIKLTPSSQYLDDTLKLTFNEWGKGDYEKFKEKAFNSLAHIFALVENDKVVGCFVIRDNDISSHPHYSPNLACVCVDKNERGRGLSRILLNGAIEIFKQMKLKKVYLKSSLKNYYEKFGFIPLNEVCEDGEEIYYMDV